MAYYLDVKIHTVARLDETPWGWHTLTTICVVVRPALHLQRSYRHPVTDSMNCFHSQTTLVTSTRGCCAPASHSWTKTSCKSLFEIIINNLSVVSIIVVMVPDATPTAGFKSGAHHAQPQPGHAPSLPRALCLRSRVSSYGPPFCVRPSLLKREKIVSPALNTSGRSQRDWAEPPHTLSLQVNITRGRSSRE